MQAPRCPKPLVPSHIPYHGELGTAIRLLYQYLPSRYPCPRLRKVMMRRPWPTMDGRIDGGRDGEVRRRDGEI